jgi:hypothetical protein
MVRAFLCGMTQAAQASDCMSETATSIRVVIPLTLRKRNGRP